MARDSRYTEGQHATRSLEGCRMASEWHYCRDGETYGPVSSADLKRLAGTGELLRTDLLWKDGMADWKPADQFPKLFPEEEAASVIVVPEEPAENPVAAFKFDVVPAGKRAAGTKAVSKSPVTSSGRKAQVKSNSQRTGGAKTWWVFGGGALLFLLILGAFADKKEPPKPPPDGGGGGQEVGGGGIGNTSGSKPKQSAPSGDSLAQLEHEAYEEGWKQGVGMAQGWVQQIQAFKAKSGSATGLAVLKDGIEKQAHDLRNWRDNF